MRFSVQGDYVFDRASLFLLRLVCQKKKRYRRRLFFNYGSGRPMVAPTGLIVTFIFACRGGYYPPALSNAILPKAFPCEGRGTACGG